MEQKTDPGTGEVTYVRTSAYGPYARFWNRDTRIPCTNPPFGELVAVDSKTGDIAWRSPLGIVPALEEKGVHNTGAPNLGGSIATAGGLVFVAATNDSRFRAFESKTGGCFGNRRSMQMATPFRSPTWVKMESSMLPSWRAEAAAISAERLAIA
jgi:glucose dehydrogenase